MFHEAYPDIALPFKSTIILLVQKFQRMFSITDKEKHRTPMVLTPAKVAQIGNKIGAKLYMSTHKMVQQTPVSQMIVSCELKQLKNIHITFLWCKNWRNPIFLAVFDFAIDFCNKRTLIYRTFRSCFCFVLFFFFFLNKAWIHMPGYVNAQDYRLWSSEKFIDGYGKTSLHPKTIGIYTTILRHRVVDLIFFESTITTEVYYDISFVRTLAVHCKHTVFCFLRL